MATSTDNKIKILSEVLLQYRKHPDLQDFIENDDDFVFPLAHHLNSKIVALTDKSKLLINETFNLLLFTLEIEDTGFKSLDELMPELKDLDEDEF